MDGPRRSEGRSDLCALRDLPGWCAGRQGFVWRQHFDPERSRKPEARRVSEIRAGHPGRPAACSSTPSFQTRIAHANGGDGRPASRRRLASRLPGCGRQPAQPSAHSRTQGQQENLLFKNFMDARVDYLILPLAKRVMRADQAAKASAEGYLTMVMMHEISHGLGPSFARKNGQRVDIREAIGPTYSGLEEAKADVTGMFGLQWLIDRGALRKERLNEYYASYVA